MTFSRMQRLPLLALLLLALTACAGNRYPLGGSRPDPVYTREAFQADEKHSR